MLIVELAIPNDALASFIDFAYRIQETPTSATQQKFFLSSSFIVRAIQKVLKRGALANFRKELSGSLLIVEQIRNERNYIKFDSSQFYFGSQKAAKCNQGHAVIWENLLNGKC